MEHRDPGRRLHRIVIVWFCLCLTAIILAWNAAGTAGGPHADADAAPVIRTARGR